MYVTFMSISTRSLADVVKETIEKDAVIKKGLARNLINIRALARVIQGTVGEKTSLEAIVSAIRRYPVQEMMEDYGNIGRLISKLTLKNKILGMTLDNDPDILNLLNKISMEMDYKTGNTFRFVKGFENIRVAMDEKNIDKVLDVVPKQRILQTNRGLAEILISLSKEAAYTPSVISSITTEVSMNGVNITDFMSCDAEMIILVFERDALKTYEVLSRFSEAPPDGVDSA